MTKSRRRSFLFQRMNLPPLPLLLALAAPVAGSESLPTKEVLTLRLAKAIADAAEATVVADP